MEAKPITAIASPHYPTRREFLAVSTLAAAGLAGGGLAFAEGTVGMVVAPIFEHGAGRGVAGCVVVSPPVFLSEEEALQVIREELGKHGITLKAGGTLDKVRLAPKMTKYDKVETPDGKTEYKESVVEVARQAKPLELDGHDAEKKVAVEFISSEDYFKMGGPMSGSTVQEYEFKKVAAEVAEAAKKHGGEPIFLGVFYDPAARLPKVRPVADNGNAADWQAAWKEARDQGKEESKKLLRAQAVDFVAWLKKQNAIQ